MNQPGAIATHAQQDTKIDELDQALPQTQCTKCGYDGCRPYAQAIADGQAAINRCPPGGQAGIRVLARLTGTPEIPLDITRGTHTALTAAVIDEEHCIGCTLCIQACPADAISGANKYMHTVLPELCTGCELCVAPCPVDCIRMEPVQPEREWTRVDADAARQRFLNRQARLRRIETTRHRPAQATRATSATPRDTAPVMPDRKSAAIAAALARARARRTT